MFMRKYLPLLAFILTVSLMPAALGSDVGIGVNVVPPGAVFRALAIGMGTIVMGGGGLLIVLRGFMGDEPLEDKIQMMVGALVVIVFIVAVVGIL
jgi:hypothetical protein